MLPNALVEDYENGIGSDAVEEHCEAYGMNRSTFTACSSNHKSKRPRVDRPILENTNG